MVNRSEESTRQYGPFNESIERAAIIATQMTGLEIGPKEFLKCMIALKLSRMRYNLKEDTMMDGIAYIFGLSEYERECEKQVAEFDKVFYKAPNGEKIQTGVMPFEAMSDGGKLTYIQNIYAGKKVKSTNNHEYEVAIDACANYNSNRTNIYVNTVDNLSVMVYRDGIFAEIID